MQKLVALLLAATLAAPAAAAPKDRATPYWASISAREAMMRAGPGRNFPATWLYRRADLPIKVLEVYPSWRKVQDPGGTIGWMLVNLLSDTRTAVVTGGEPRPLRNAPNANAPIVFKAQPGVVARIESCAAGWCKIDAAGKSGYVAVDHIWGVDPAEKVG